MQCNKPIWLEDKKIHVPCGKCRACRISRCREWSVRIMHETESLRYAGSLFATLTYSDENIPRDMSVNVGVLQKFHKRLRKRVEPRLIKFYACGEYGDKLGRPHYHSIIFGISMSEHKFDRYGHVVKGPIVDAWQEGYVYIGTVTYNSARYVASYIHKKKYGYLRSDTRSEPFQVASRGIGLEYALSKKERIIEKGGCFRQGKNVGFPRYYRKKLEIPRGILVEKANEYAKELRDHYRARGWSNLAVNLGVPQQDGLDQWDKELKAREELYNHRSLE